MKSEDNPPPTTSTFSAAQWPQTNRMSEVLSQTEPQRAHAAQTYPSTRHCNNSRNTRSTQRIQHIRRTPRILPIQRK